MRITYAKEKASPTITGSCHALCVVFNVATWSKTEPLSSLLNFCSITINTQLKLKPSKKRE